MRYADWWERPYLFSSHQPIYLESTAHDARNLSERGFLSAIITREGEPPHERVWLARRTSERLAVQFSVGAKVTRIIISRSRTHICTQERGTPETARIYSSVCSSLRMTAPNRDAQRRTQMKLHWEMETGSRQVESGNWNANLGNWKKENGIGMRIGMALLGHRTIPCFSFVRLTCLYHSSFHGLQLLQIELCYYRYIPNILYCL